LTRWGGIQGGSDISGTISKLHRCVKKYSFLLIFSAKASQLSAETIIVNKQSYSSKNESTGRHRSRESL
jgi:hypothetical protein